MKTTCWDCKKPSDKPRCKSCEKKHDKKNGVIRRSDGTILVIVLGTWEDMK